MARVASKALGLCDLVIRYVSVKRFIYQIVRSTILCHYNNLFCVEVNNNPMLLQQFAKRCCVEVYHDATRLDIKSIMATEFLG